MKYFSAFSGIGGFELGIEGECVGFSEVDKYAIETYKKHFPNHKNYGDITKITTDTLPDFDCFVGGFPCQAFSIAGKRRGFKDTRGTLFFDCARIIADKRPRNFVLENVRGLLSHEKGETFKTIIRTLDELGYVVEWQVLNSKDFGVPQNRQRVFIVGHLRGECRSQVFPIRENFKTDNVVSTLTRRYYEAQSTGSYLRQISPKGASQGNRVYDPRGLSTTLASQAGGLGAKTGLYAMKWERTEKGKKIRKDSQKKGKDYTPFSKGCRKLVPKKGKPISTLTSQAIGKDSLIGNEFKIRRLTPLGMRTSSRLP